LAIFSELKNGGDFTKQEENQIMVYDNICTAAKRSGLSINFIESETGLSIGSLCKWNKVSPTAKSLKRVAKLLGVTVDSLLEEKETGKSENRN